MKTLMIFFALLLILLAYQIHSEQSEPEVRGPGSCDTCHSKYTESEKDYNHGSYTKCEDCHLPHVDNDPSVLMGDPITMCLEPCHMTMGRSHNTGFGLINPTNMKVQDVTCTNACHNPHHSEHKGILRLANRDLCFVCHDL